MANLKEFEEAVNRIYESGKYKPLCNDFFINFRGQLCVCPVTASWLSFEKVEDIDSENFMFDHIAIKYKVMDRYGFRTYQINNLMNGFDAYQIVHKPFDSYYFPSFDSTCYDLGVQLRDKWKPRTPKELYENK